MIGPLSRRACVGWRKAPAEKETANRYICVASVYRGTVLSRESIKHNFLNCDPPIGSANLAPVRERTEPLLERRGYFYLSLNVFNILSTLIRSSHQQNCIAFRHFFVCILIYFVSVGVAITRLLIGSGYRNISLLPPLQTQDTHLKDMLQGTAWWRKDRWAPSETTNQRLLNDC